jgi:phospholipase/lecithinase/hemolysin
MRQVAVAAVLCAAFSSTAYAQSSFSTVHVFGDSYSDRGRIPGIVYKQYPEWPHSWILGPAPTGVTTPPPASPYFNGRFSNGPTWAERLPKLIRVRPNSKQNRAVGGATIGSFPTANPTLQPGDPFYKKQFPSDNLESVFLEGVFTGDPTTIPGCREAGTCIDLPGIQDQIDGLGGSRFKPSAVVALFGGGNDYFAFIDRVALNCTSLFGCPGGVGSLETTPTLRDVPKEVAYVTKTTETSIRKLAKYGAKTLLVPNMPNIGSLPAYNGSQCIGKQATNYVCTPKEREALQHSAKIGTALSVQHNAALNAKLGKLAKNLGVNIFVVDFATAVDTVMANPARFGFKNTHDACVQKSVPPPTGWPASPPGIPRSRQGMRQSERAFVLGPIPSDLSRASDPG